MSQSPQTDGSSITDEALREFIDWNGVFRRETRSRACEIAAGRGAESLVTPDILKEAVLSTCAEIVERIRSEPGGERQNGARAA